MTATLTMIGVAVKLEWLSWYRGTGATHGRTSFIRVFKRTPLQPSIVFRHGNAKRQGQPAGGPQAASLHGKKPKCDSTTGTAHGQQHDHDHELLID